MIRVLIVDDMKGWIDYHSYIISNLFEKVEIVTATSAREGYDKLIENHDNPFNIIISDLQMENDFEPKYAGEWFIEQIRTFKNYLNTKIVIISASYNIKNIAENLNTYHISKNTARNFPNSYNFLTEL